MPEIVVYRAEDGKLAGHGDKGDRAYKRFLAKVRELPDGGTLAFSWKEPRAPGPHRHFFGALRNLFDRQETFTSADELRTWLTVGAGYVRFVQGREVMVALPVSIAFDQMDDDEFAEFLHRIKTFLWEPHAHAVLWPHLSAQAAYDAMDGHCLECWA